jgi:hypothetical protein
VRNQYKALNVQQSLDLLVTLSDPNLDAALRTRTARARLVEHLRAIARDKPARKGKR